MNINSEEIWKKLHSLNVVVMVAIAPRPGVDFLQSLFDNHENIITFDGWLLFNEFYNNSISLNGTYKFILGTKKNESSKKFKIINNEDIFYEFAWNHLHKFDSRYDNVENKGNLGKLKNEYNKINIKKFVETCLELLGKRPISRKNLLMVIYAAFAICRKEDIFKKTVLIHQAHLPEFLHEFVEDFPNAKIIGCMRDQRNSVTYINKWFYELFPLKPSITGSDFFIKISLFGLYDLRSFDSKNIRISILEKLHENPEDYLKKICNWLEIKFSKKMLISSWNGKEWSGDILSNSISKTFDKNRYYKSKLLWSNMSLIDKKIFEVLLANELIYYGYIKNKNRLLTLIIPFLILFPFKYELFQAKFLIKQHSLKLLLTLFKRYMKTRFFLFKKYILNLKKQYYLYNYF